MWKFLDEKDGKIVSRNGDHEWEIGREYEVDGEVAACAHGFHCSRTIRDAFHYVAGTVLAEVIGEGEFVDRGDKLVFQKMKITRAWRFGPRDSVALAVFAAEKVLSAFETAHPGDERPRRAIEAARAWLAEPSEASRNAAASAAYAAASAANAANASTSAAYAAYAANAGAYAAANAANAGAYAAANAAASAAYAANAANAAYVAYAAAYADAAAAAYADAAAAANAAKRKELRDDIEAWLRDRIAQLQEITCA